MTLGSLSIHMSKNRNIALVSNFGCRFKLNDKNALWARILRAKYDRKYKRICNLEKSHGRLENM